MSKIKNQIKKLRAIPDILEEAVKEEVKEHRVLISRLNREQLNKGQKADGSDMPNYVPDSKQPSAPGKITLFETGDFQSGIEPMFEDDSFRNVGLDDKTWFLVSKYGKILGLTKESKDTLRKAMRPGLVKRIKRKMNEQR